MKLKVLARDPTPEMQTAGAHAYQLYGRWSSESDRHPQTAAGFRAAWDAAAEAPIPMILHCPACHQQHVDAAEPEHLGPGRWKNPPHRTHLCHGCGHLWRPANVATTGVATLE